ncbi:hypothetical protein DFR67_112153 [Williamsia limnetica]|uniref:Excreted virulence factor EspC (Type VII ESX diderm) n=1 Tax=Williamsia limnetica TaxID=882452 RepID=A0A318RXD9_WILLI|nr:hypothetical protein [Williamsia limnetica]PYE14691.1 hypothetical protein DFR67_112153 [Williamsia limnetica]
MTDEVKFTNEQWDALAEAAEVFAQTLDDERGLLTHVLGTNWAGECAEGVGVTENLKDLLRGADASFATAIRDEAQYLRAFAAQCVNSKNALNGSDMGSAIQFKK